MTVIEGQQDIQILEEIVLEMTFSHQASGRQEWTDGEEQMGNACVQDPIGMDACWTDCSLLCAMTVRHVRRQTPCLGNINARGSDQWALPQQSRFTVVITIGSAGTTILAASRFMPLIACIRKLLYSYFFPSEGQL